MWVHSVWGVGLRVVRSMGSSGAWCLGFWVAECWLEFLGSRKWRLGWGIDRLKEQLSQLSLSLFSNRTLVPKALNPTPQP